VCCGVARITVKTFNTNSAGTRAWNRSLIELTKTRRGSFQRNGSPSEPGCTASPNPGPLVGGLPSVWYLAWPIALSRLASVRA
jgi:hypothetical protein